MFFLFIRYGHIICICVCLFFSVYYCLVKRIWKQVFWPLKHENEYISLGHHSLVGVSLVGRHFLSLKTLLFGSYGLFFGYALVISPFVEHVTYIGGVLLHWG